MCCEYQYFLLVLTVNFYCCTKLFTLLGIVEIQLLSNSVFLELCGQVFVSLIGSLSPNYVSGGMLCWYQDNLQCSEYLSLLQKMISILNKYSQIII